MSSSGCIIFVFFEVATTRPVGSGGGAALDGEFPPPWPPAANNGRVWPGSDETKQKMVKNVGQKSIFWSKIKTLIFWSIIKNNGINHEYTKVFRNFFTHISNFWLEHHWMLAMAYAAASFASCSSLDSIKKWLTFRSQIFKFQIFLSKIAVFVNKMKFWNVH